MLKNLLRKGLRSTDIFKTPASLRYKQKRNVPNILFSIFSLALFFFFAYLFVHKMVRMVGLYGSQIHAISQLRTNSNTSSIKNVMFAISYEYQQIKIQDMSDYFQMNAFIVDKSTGVPQWIKVGMVPCQQHHWKNVGSNFNQYFSYYKYYCLPEVIEALTAEHERKFLKIQFSKCHSKTSCKSPAQINRVYKDILAGYDSFPIYIGFANAQPQIYERAAMKKKIDTLVYYVTQDISQRVIMNFDQLKIYTDISVLPLREQITYQNSLVFSSMTYAFQQIDPKTQNTLLNIQLSLTGNQFVYHRKVTKMDEALSYFGGMYFPIVLIFLFFLKAYNQYRYELHVAENCFDYDNEGNKIWEKDFGFFDYVKYRIYYLIFLVSGKKFNWADCPETQDTMFQGKKILDVEGMYRRLDIMEKLMWERYDTNVLLMTSLLKQNRIDAVSETRMTFEYFNLITKQKKSIKVQQIIRQQQKSSFYLSDIPESENQSQKQIVHSIRLSEKYQTHKQISQLQKTFLQADLKKYLKLHAFSQECDNIVEHYQEYLEAKDMIIPYSYDQIERQLTNSFINLQYEEKKRLVGKIPIVIMYRLMLKAKDMEEEKGQIGNVERLSASLIWRSSIMKDPKQRDSNKDSNNKDSNNRDSNNKDSNNKDSNNKEGNGSSKVFNQDIDVI